MFDISNNGIITITRGDSAVTNLIINIGTELEPIVFDMTDSFEGGTTEERVVAKLAKVYLGIMEAHQPFEHAIVRKVFTYKDFDIDTHTLCIKFRPEDTENLSPGVYYYSIKLYRPQVGTEDEKIDTLIDKKKFIIID